MRRAGVPLAAAVLLFLGLIAGGAPPAQADGIGIYPSFVQLQSALRGGEYFTGIGLINDADSPKTFEFQPKGEVAAWISVHRSTDRNVPLNSIEVAPREELRLLARVVIPPDAPNGPHQGELQVVAIPKATELDTETGAEARIGVAIRVEVEVTGSQSLTGLVREISIEDTEVGYPLRIRTSFENTGNVNAQPKIDFKVKTGDGSIVGEASYGETVIRPGENETVTAQWDTTGHDPGDYVASITVSLGDGQIDARDLGFKLLPRGTFSREGELEGLRLANQPYPDAFAKILATFRNTGLIETQGRFVGEFYRGSKLIETVASEERLALVGETVNLEVFAKIPEEGTYTIRGKVNYEGKETAVRELTFRIGSDGGSPLWIWIAIGAAAVAGVGAAGAGWTVWRKRKAAA